MKFLLYAFILLLATEVKTCTKLESNKKNPLKIIQNEAVQNEKYNAKKIESKKDVIWGESIENKESVLEIVDTVISSIREIECAITQEQKLEKSEKVLVKIKELVKITKNHPKVIELESAAQETVDKAKNFIISAQKLVSQSTKTRKQLETFTEELFDGIQKFEEKVKTLKQIATTISNPIEI